MWEEFRLVALLSAVSFTLDGESMRGLWCEDEPLRGTFELAEKSTSITPKSLSWVNQAISVRLNSHIIDALSADGASALYETFENSDSLLSYC